MVGILQLLLILAGAEALNNTFITNHYSSEDPDGKFKTLQINSKKNMVKSPDAFNALGYDTVYLISRCN